MHHKGKPCVTVGAAWEVRCPGPGIPGHCPGPCLPPAATVPQRRPAAALAANLACAWRRYLSCTALVSSATKQRNARRGAEMDRSVDQVLAPSAEKLKGALAAVGYAPTLNTITLS